ncbi:MAG: hypothetical protein P8I83_12530 [Paracoccaceae bacterium]|nr:hypothetical protein [Paracoccaceae bacterium]
MTVVSIREVTPEIGKEELVESRMRRAAGVMARHGAITRLFKVAVGGGAGDYNLQSMYSKFEEGAVAFKNFGNDPEFHALFRERNSNPAGEIRGPNVYRMVYGAPTKPPRPVLVQRLYHMPRNNVQSVLELAPQLDKLMQTVDVAVGIAVPIIADDHETMGVVYRFKSMEHWGTSLDQMVDNKDFQGLVSKANELGSLKQSRMLLAI